MTERKTPEEWAAHVAFAAAHSVGLDRWNENVANVVRLAMAQAWEEGHAERLPPEHDFEFCRGNPYSQPDGSSE